MRVDLSTEVHNRPAENQVWRFNRVLCAENSGPGGLRITGAVE